MASRDIVEAFNDSLNRLNQGETLDQVVQRYPALSDDLRGLLTASGVVPRYALPDAEVLAARARLQPDIDRLIESIPERRLPPWIIPGIIIGLIVAGLVAAALLTRGGAGVSAPMLTETTAPEKAITMTAAPAQASPTAPRPTLAPSTSVPPTSAPPISVPPTTVPPTSAPPEPPPDDPGDDGGGGDDGGDD